MLQAINHNSRFESTNILYMYTIQIYHFDPCKTGGRKKYINAFLQV